MGIEREFAQELMKDHDDYKIFVSYFKQAQESGVGFEFFDYFLSDLASQRERGEPRNIPAACWYAACEWDI